MKPEIVTPLTETSAKALVDRVAYADRVASAQVVALLLALDAASREQAQAPLLKALRRFDDEQCTRDRRNSRLCPEVPRLHPLHWCRGCEARTAIATAEGRRGEEER